MNIIIVGGGKTGRYLAPILTDGGSSVVVVESRRDVVRKLQEELPGQKVVLGSGTSPEVLERCGVMSADVLIAATGSDEVNLVASTLAKMEYQVPRVVARVNNPKNSWMFNESMGVDVGINQADLLARSVQEGLDMEDVFTIMSGPAGRGRRDRDRPCGRHHHPARRHGPHRRRQRAGVHERRGEARAEAGVCVAGREDGASRPGAAGLVTLPLPTRADG